MARRIMVVEDDQPILELMEILLRRLGYEPILVMNGLEALEEVKKSPPELILLDIMMTPINGWEILEKLRGEYGQKDLPVLLFTAAPMVQKEVAKLNDPALGILQKPVSFAELSAALQKFLSR
ncbi:MAG: response regulator [Methanoregula sp.]|nr:response regulator [Methanoregula sp.]